MTLRPNSGDDRRKIVDIPKGQDRLLEFAQFDAMMS